MTLPTDNKAKGGQILDNEDFFSGVFVDGFTFSLTEEELKVKTDVDYIRTPRNELIILDNAQYKGRAKVKNEKYGYDYEAHLWLVDFIRVGDIVFHTPKKGLLQIRTKRLHEAGLLGSVQELFVGRCRLLAEGKGRILSISDY